MSRIIQAKVGPLTSSSVNNIALSQTVTGAGTVTLNGSLVSGGVAILDTPRRVVVDSLGNDLGITFTATGTDWSGNPISATVTGGSGGGADFGISFATVTKITTSGSTSGSGITVGTNGVADSRPIFLDPYGFAPTSLQVDASGTVNWTVSQTLDNPTDPNWLAATGAAPASLSNVTWINHPDAALVGATGSVQGNYAYVPAFTRITLNSGSGSVVYSVIQSASPS